jgi:hypothetical protein
MTERAGRGSLTGSWKVREDQRPGFRGVLELEQDAPKGSRLWLTAWLRRDGIGNEFLSIVAEPATKGGRARR